MAIGIGIGLSPSFGGGGAGVSYTAEAEALFARMSVAPDATRKGLINTATLSLLTGAVSGSNIWAKLDALYLTAAHDQQAGSLNWKGTSYTLVPSGGMGAGDFTTDRGYTGDAIAKYLDTGFSDDTAAVNWSQNSLSLGCWVNNNVASGNLSVGLDGGGNVRVQPNSGGTVAGRAHTSTSVSTTGAVTRQGFVAVNRSASNAQELYRAGASIATSAAVSGAPIASTITLLKSQSFFSADRVAAATIGGSLTANEHLDLYNALNTYLTAVGGA
jgi:hypothetical protein